MRRATLRRSRAAALGVAVALAISVFSGCTATQPSDPTPTTAEGQQTVTYPELRAALPAAEPRVQDVGIVESLSGTSNVMTVGVEISGDDPVTTASLTAMLVAVREDLPEVIDQLDFIVRDDAENSHIIDFSDAVAGLPDDVTVLYDGALTIIRADLDKL